MRKMDGVLEHIAPPPLFGPEDAEVTLIGWGSTEGVIREAIEQLAAEGIVANNLQINWLVPLHADGDRGDRSPRRKRSIIVENNYSGQFARYLRSETSFVADGHIRKYDGEPFMPHHIVDGVKTVLAGRPHAVRAGARDPGLGGRCASWFAEDRATERPPADASRT